MPRIDISWEGPLSAEQAEKLNDEERDYGVYAAYGRSSVYGPGSVLLYIGKANEQTFGVRIPQHIWHGGSRYGGFPMQYHVGRLCGEHQPTNERWGSLIDVAESLLIHSHSPSWNSQHVATLELPEGYENTRVFNWGYYRNLLPEVSGARWYEDPQEIDNIWTYDLPVA